MNNEPTTNRRNTLKGIGAALGTAGATGLAGCAGVLEDNADTTDSGDRPSENTDDSSSTEKPDSEPEYEEVVDVPGDADLTESDKYRFTAGVERSEDGESEFLSSDSYEVKEAYVMRDPDVLDEKIFQSEIEATEPVRGDTRYVVESAYDGVEEIVREAGLYNSVLDDLEVGSNGEFSVPGELMLPGANRLHLEIGYDNGNTSGEFTVDEQINVEKSQSDSLEQAWIEDREMFSEFRKLFRAHIMNGATTNWMGIAEDVEETVNEEYDMESLNLKNRLQRTASHWILEASEAIGGGGPSGQADFLGYTLEELEGVETTVIPTQGHHTVLAYDRDSDKTYHVETGRGGRTNFPPGEGNHASSSPEISPIWPEQGDQVGGAMTTMLLIGQLDHSMYGDSRAGFVGEETAITGMERFREGTDQKEMVDEMQSLNLSMVLSPSLDFKVEGAIEDLERSIEY
ncbi:hypothetical protein [Halorussus amylolyticus]|uniref:hypothetical protein n=1 Tax=Halorussus amylolyticus TaxID=1126242 RepID=UPI00138F6B82|nr:hypothetical protein [Halorussus amylolyticus]